jgi:hypothetical protein
MTQLIVPDGTRNLDAIVRDLTTAQHREESAGHAQAATALRNVRRTASGLLVAGTAYHGF